MKLEWSKDEGLGPNVWLGPVNKYSIIIRCKKKLIQKIFQKTWMGSRDITDLKYTGTTDSSNGKFNNGNQRGKIEF